MSRARQLLNAWRGGDDGSNFRSDELEELVATLRSQVQRFAGTSLRFIDWCRLCHYRLENTLLHPLGQGRCLAVSKASGSEWVKELLCSLEVVLTLVDDHDNAGQVINLKAELTDTRVKLSDLRSELRERDEQDERRYNLVLGTVLKANGVLRFRSLSKVRQFISHLDTVKEEFGIRDDGTWVEIDEDDVVEGDEFGDGGSEWGSRPDVSGGGNSDDSELWDLPEPPESVQQRRTEFVDVNDYAEGLMGGSERASSRQSVDSADAPASRPPSRQESRHSRHHDDDTPRPSSRRSSASPRRRSTSGLPHHRRRHSGSAEGSLRASSGHRRRPDESSSRRRSSGRRRRDASTHHHRSSDRRRSDRDSSRRRSSDRHRRSSSRRRSASRDGRRIRDDAGGSRRSRDRRHRRRSRSVSSDETIRASSSHPVETSSRHRRRSSSESVHADVAVPLSADPVFPGLNEPLEGVELKHMVNKNGPLCGGFGNCQTSKDYLKMLEGIKFDKPKPGESEALAYLKAETEMISIFESVCPRTVSIYDLLSVFTAKAAVWKHSMAPLLRKEAYYTSFKMFLKEFREKQFPNLREMVRAEAEKRVQGPKESIDKYFEGWVELQTIMKYKIDDRTDHFIEGLRDSRIKRLVAQENYAGRERTVEAVKQHAIYLSGRFLVQETVAEVKRGRRVAAVTTSEDASDRQRHSDSKKQTKTPKMKAKVSKVSTANVSTGQTDGRPKTASDEAKLKGVIEWGRKAGIKGCFNCFKDHTFRLDGSNCSLKCPVCRADFHKSKRHLITDCPKLPSDKNSISSLADKVLKEDQKRSK